MRALYLLTFLASVPFFTGVHAGQVPVVNGVIGGVPNTTSSSTRPTTFSAASVAAGGLRIVENSGICGTKRDFPLKSKILKFRQKRRPASIKLRAMEIWPLPIIYGTLYWWLSCACGLTQALRFWYFDARNSPDTAPLVLWFNGGVGFRTAHRKWIP